MKKAVFPGSFDPITLGHVDIIKRGLEIFDEVIVAIGVNAEKKYMFNLETRKRFIEEAFAGVDGVKVMEYQGLTVDFCKEQGAKFILRGLRNATDMEYEKSIAMTNQAMSGIESVFLLNGSGKSHIASSIVRDVMRNDGDYTMLVPKCVRK